MTLYARCPANLDTGETPYLTPGKLYEVVREAGNGKGFDIRDDGESLCYCLWEGCAHLDGGNWERVERHPLLARMASDGVMFGLFGACTFILGVLLGSNL